MRKKVWPYSSYFLHRQSMKMCTRYFFSNCVWSQRKYQPSTILLVKNAAGELKDRKGRIRCSVCIPVMFHSSINCSYNLENHTLFSAIWKLIEVLWLFSGEQAKKPPDDEWTGSPEHISARITNSSFSSDYSLQSKTMKFLWVLQDFKECKVPSLSC